MSDLIDLAPRILLYLAGLPLVLFVGFYVALSAWRSTEVGRIIVGLCLSLLAIIVISVSRAIFGEWPGIDVVRIVVYTAMNVGLWHLLCTLRRTQRTNCDGTLDPTLPVALFDLLRRRKRPTRKDPS